MFKTFIKIIVTPAAIAWVLFSGLGNAGLAAVFLGAFIYNWNLVIFLSIVVAGIMAVGLLLIHLARLIYTLSVKDELFAWMGIVTIMAVGVVGYFVLGYEASIATYNRNLDRQESVNLFFARVNENNSRFVDSLRVGVTDGYKQTVKQRSPKTAAAALEGFNKLSQTQLNLNRQTIWDYERMTNQINENEPKLGIIMDVKEGQGIKQAIIFLFFIAFIFSIGMDTAGAFIVRNAVRNMQEDESSQNIPGNANTYDTGILTLDGDYIEPFDEENDYSYSEEFDDVTPGDFEGGNIINNKVTENVTPDVTPNVTEETESNVTENVTPDVTLKNKNGTTKKKLTPLQKKIRREVQNGNDNRTHLADKLNVSRRTIIRNIQQMNGSLKEAD